MKRFPLEDAPVGTLRLTCFNHCSDQNDRRRIFRHTECLEAVFHLSKNFLIISIDTIIKDSHAITSFRLTEFIIE